MESGTKGRGKAKETGQSKRQVLGDIGNLEVFRIIEGKEISRPITRNHAELLANAHASANLVLQANEQGAVQGNKNVVVPSLDNRALVHKKHGVEDLAHKPNVEPVDMVSFEFEEKADSISERMSRERSCRKVQTLTSALITPSKATSGILIEPENQPVDIDAVYANDDPEVAEYLDDIYKFYKLSEDKHQVSDYMRSQPDINEKMRFITVDWLLDVHRRFKLMPETLFLTINIIDQYLSLTVVPRTELQLVGISSMFIASKYEEIKPPQVNDFIGISNNAYTKNQILSMEKVILNKLKWCLTIPTPYVFLVRLIRASVQPDQEMENLAFYLAELGLMHYEVVIWNYPSMIAAAAVYSAKCTLNRHPFWTETLQHQSGYCTQQIKNCAKLLVCLHASAKDSKITAYCKFSSEDRGFVALLSPPKEIFKHL